MLCGFPPPIASTPRSVHSPRPDTSDDLFTARQGLKAPAGFLGKKERHQGVRKRDAFAGWRE
jgi:hypothetical protein